MKNWSKVFPNAKVELTNADFGRYAIKINGRTVVEVEYQVDITYTCQHIQKTVEEYEWIEDLPVRQIRSLGRWCKKQVAPLIKLQKQQNKADEKMAKLKLKGITK